jgi:sulfofructose kinase
LLKRSNHTSTVDCLGLGIMPLDLLFSVDKYPKTGAKIDGLGLKIQGGGPVPNVLAGLARLGHSGALITAVADDLIGRTGLGEVATEGVDTRYVVTKRGSSDTAVGLIERGSGRRTMVLNRVIHVTPRDISTAELPIPRLVHLDGRDMPACLKLARWAKRIGATVCFDIGSMRNDVSEVFPLVDHLVVADAYALPFTGTRTARRAIEALGELCPGTIVVTEGIQGSLGQENGQWVRQAAFRVKAVDTTGAGDAFHVGYLYGLLHGLELKQRLLLGSAAAALNCMSMGARSALPTRRQLQQFLREKRRKYA